jgi:hypothetical protein
MNHHIRQFLEQNQLILLREFPVLWKGWDCDFAWYLTENENCEKVLVATDHGNPYIAEPGELLERIEYYKNVTKQSEEILELLEKK